MGTAFRRIIAKFGNMRKEQDFVICPVSNDPEHVRTIQSDKRIARVNLENKTVILSDGKGGHQGFHKLLPENGAKRYPAPADLLTQIETIETMMGKNPKTFTVDSKPNRTVTVGPVSIFDL